MRAWRWSGIVAVAAACCVLSGCGGAPELGTAVTGVLTVDGQPAAGDEDEEEYGYEVRFYPLDASGEIAAGAGNFSAMVAEGGQFTVHGRGMEDIPAGKYRVAVYNWGPPAGGGGEADDGEKVDLFQGKYDKDKSTLVRDVNPGDVIELAITTTES